MDFDIYKAFIRLPPLAIPQITRRLSRVPAKSGSGDHFERPKGVRNFVLVFPTGSPSFHFEPPTCPELRRRKAQRNFVFTESILYK